MYDYIRGRIDRITPEYIVIDNQSVGYRVFTPNSYAFTSHKEESIIYVHLHVRDDAHLLFGFQSLDERELFRKLIQVSGIGPKGALAILATGNPVQVMTAIENEDETYLVKFPGVGKKTARQIILDLKGKLGALLDNVEMASAPDELPLFEDSTVNHALEDALLALATLGYSERELKKIRPQLEQSTDLLTTDDYMKKALTLLLM